MATVNAQRSTRGQGLAFKESRNVSAGDNKDEYRTAPRLPKPELNTAKLPINHPVRQMDESMVYKILLGPMDSDGPRRLVSVNGREKKINVKLSSFSSQRLTLRILKKYSVHDLRLLLALNSFPAGKIPGMSRSELEDALVHIAQYGDMVNFDFDTPVTLADYSFGQLESVMKKSVLPKADTEQGKARVRYMNLFTPLDVLLSRTEATDYNANADEYYNMRPNSSKSRLRTITPRGAPYQVRSNDILLSLSSNNRPSNNRPSNKIQSGTYDQRFLASRPETKNASA